MDENLPDNYQTDEDAARSISCTAIPEAFLDKIIAKKHFSQFGRIRNFILRPNKYSCIVQYENADDAEAAFHMGRIYNGIAFNVELIEDPIPVQQYDNFIDPDVQDELDAMENVPKKSATNSISRDVISRKQKSDLRQSKFGKSAQHTSKNLGFAMSTAAATTTTTAIITEPLPAILSSAEKQLKSELESILRKPALTAEEKFLVLDARDKLIRLQTKKNVDIKSAESFKGICPDMCPEKERMMREAKHQVAVYELQEGSRNVMNHLNAVKQYSRSSADQEAPLLHELRPEPVLKLAMIYLLQNIMDLCDLSDTNLSDWFHFLWDRTRSIRKDITQQELCSLESVSLVEQCARFHIHCAARLIAEEPQVFDQKINTENLTKCLQSLKYMYHDLNLKLIRCPNEAEFRSYVVLLNLHDANFLWEVKQFRPEIRNSPEVRFAIAVYLAMESNNYVKFFSLVRSTTYMNSCILLRYFTQVRVKALNVILKAYVPRSPVIISISYLQYTLAYEDYEQCAQFMEYYGLACDRDDDRVILDRHAFYYPDIPFLMERAINVVEHKRHSTVGEAVYGDILDPKDILEKYEPHDSFDENGLLLYRAWTAEDQNYFHPEAKIEARRKQNRGSPFPAISVDEDDSLFKKPTALPPISPRAMSPKPKPTPKSNTHNEMKSLPFKSASTFKEASLVAPKIVAADNIFSTNKNQSAFAPTSNVLSGFANSQSNATVKKTTTTIITTDQPDSAKSTFSFTSPTTRNNTFFNDQAISTASSSFAPVNPGASIFSSSFGNKTSNNIFNQAKADATETNTHKSPSANIFGNFLNEENPKDTISNSNWMRNTFHTPESNVMSTPSTPGANQKLFDSFTGIVPLKLTPIVDIEKEKEEKERLRKLKEADEEKQRKADEEKREMKFKEREEQKRIIDQASNNITLNLIDEAIENEIKQIASKEIEHHRFIEQQMEIIYLELLTETVTDDVYKVACEARDILHKSILKNYFKVWHKYTQKSIVQRKIIENSPFWLTSKTLPEIVPEFVVPLQAETLSSMKRYRSGVPQTFSLPPTICNYIDIWPNISISLIAHLQETKNNHQSLVKSKIYWKCIFSLPDYDEDDSGLALGQFIDKTIKRQSKFSIDENIFFAEQKLMNRSSKTINVCLRKLYGTKTEKQKIANAKDFAGTNAILFFTTVKNLSKTRMRLENIVRETEVFNAVAICVYNSKEDDIERIRSELVLDELLGEKMIEQCIFLCRETNSIITEISQSLHFVATRSSIENDLKMQQIGPLLKECLAEEFWIRIKNSIEQNPAMLNAAQQFSFLRDYHNAAILRLISMCTPCVDSQNEFPFELRKFVPPQQLNVPLDLEYFPTNWKNNENRYTKIANLLNSLRIQSDINFTNITELENMEQIIMQFSQNLINDKHKATKLAYKIIQRILTYLRPHEIDRIELKIKLNNYNWIDCMSIISIDLLTYYYHEAIKNNQLPEYVIYDIHEYDQYIKTNWWLKLNEEQLKSLTANVVRNIDLQIDEFDQKIKRQKIDVTQLAAKEQMEMNEIMAKGFACLEKADRVLRAVDENREISREISKELDLSLYLHDHSINEMSFMIKSDLEN